MRFSLVLTGLALGLTLGSVALAQHGNWHDTYQDATGVRCCGPRDCTQTTGRLLAQTPGRVQVEIQGVALWLPTGSVHASEDGAFWVCRQGRQEAHGQLTSEQIRCVFVATGG